MSGKTLLIFGTLTFSSLVGIASAKSYDITLDKPAMLGSTELKPGEYKVKLEGAEAVFTDARSAKSFSIPVKVETAEKKFGYTTVESNDQAGMDTIQAIDLGGSNTRLTLSH